MSGGGGWGVGVDTCTAFWMIRMILSKVDNQWGDRHGSQEENMEGKEMT